MDKEHAPIARMDRFKTPKEMAVLTQLVAITTRLMETLTTATHVPHVKVDRFQTNSKTNVSLKVNHPDLIAAALSLLMVITNANNAKMDRFLTHKELNVLTDLNAITTNTIFKMDVSNVLNAHSVKQ
jgi:hypothetical protein